MPASDADKCLYVRRDDEGKVILTAATWVDDVLIAGEPDAVAAFRKEISTDFAVRDFGEPKDFIGCEIERNTKLGICDFKQTKYIEKLDERYGVQPLQGEGPHAPMDHSLNLNTSQEDDTGVDPTEFRSIVGALHYCAHCKRPEIAASISILSKFLIDPAIKHMRQAQRVLAYLLWSKHQGLTCRKDPPTGPPQARTVPKVISEYSDATFADCLETRRSHTGYMNACMLRLLSVSAVRATIQVTSAAPAIQLPFECENLVSWKN